MDSYPIKHPLDDGSGFKNWAPKYIGEMFPLFNRTPLIINDEIVYNQELKSYYENQKILIIGGGPSAKMLTLNELGKYDNIWTMNNFFLNRLFNLLPVGLMVLGANTNLLSDELMDYLLKYWGYVHIAIEPHPKYGSIRTPGHDKYSDWDDAKEIVNNDNWTKSYHKFAFQTRYWSRCGIGARMILLAAHLGVESVDFIGIDGFSSYKTGSHFFEQNKGPEALPSSIKVLSDSQMELEMIKEYTILHDLLKKFPIKITNLASDYPYSTVKELINQ